MKWSLKQCNGESTKSKAENVKHDRADGPRMPAAWSQQVLGLIVAAVATWSILSGAGFRANDGAHAASVEAVGDMQRADIIDDILDILEDIVGGGGGG